MSFRGRKVLVTGAAGFLGSHLSERLAREGAVVRAFVHYNALGRRGWLDAGGDASAVEIVAGDLCDPSSVREAVRGVDVVFHLGALISIPYSYRAPASYLAVNAGGALHVLEAAREMGAGRVVCTSTSEVYGSAQSVPMTEEHPLRAQSPYAASKIAADQLALSFHRSFGLPVTIVRPFNAYGPRQSARAVIPSIIVQALARPSIRLGALTPTRDFNFVDDLVEGFLLAGSRDAAVGEVVHFGTGRETAIGDLAHRILALLGKELPIECEAERLRPESSEVDRLCADASKARRLLGWSPAVSIEDGLARTIEWVERNLGHYRAELHAI